MWIVYCVALMRMFKETDLLDAYIDFFFFFLANAYIDF